ncbi:DUF6036 family nucleotidyltransferase [Mesorhizobium sp. ASY16-5R]|uniref:DUF6036 family nucleotidyltransferase n=1 Tax=Mesorhizobium sp. ASY16-5R TaxID=3445772 RepID=UPI003F9F15E3
MIDRAKIEQLLIAIGDRLRRPSTIVIVGSTASMLSGQDDRQTPDIDIWYPMSDFDPGDMRQAVEAAGLRYDPRGEIGAEDIYLQILRPGITMYPPTFQTMQLGTYGNLSVAMPPPALIVATKLARATESDLEDVAWWMEHTDISRDDIENAISLIPQRRNREEATANLIFLDIDRDQDR